MIKRNLVMIFAVSLMLILCGCGNGEVQEEAADLNETFKSDLQKFEQESTSAATAQTTAGTASITENIGVLHGKVILVDAGHGKADYTVREPVAPGSTEMKAAFAAGTSGKNQTEAELNLKVAKKLKAKLEVMGATVHMTRTDETTDKSNAERAQMGNRLNADMTVRIHANGSTDPNVKGILTMIPDEKYVDKDVVSKSRRAGELIQKHMIAQTDAVNGGMQSRNDMTGFNWSEVPVVLVEMGYMTNAEEDALLELSSYQDLIVQGISEGLAEYFG